jgi:ribonuclease III
LALRRIFSANKGFSEQVYRITGIRPGRIAIYKEAFRHSSVNEQDSSKNNATDNERLEFLGDAILDAVVAELLFLRYPYKQEGFLTEMRTRVVNREQLAYLSERLGLVQMMEMKADLYKNSVALKTIGSNTLEALIGAIYLDKGYSTAKKFIARRLIGQYLDLDKLMNTTISFKATLLKWSQKQKKVITWQHSKETLGGGDVHTMTLEIDGEPFITDKNRNRKRAEELCCEKACRQLGIVTE